MTRSTVAGLAKTFGSGAMTNSIDDLEKAECDPGHRLQHHRGPSHHRPAHQEGGHAERLQAHRGRAPAHPALLLRRPVAAAQARHRRRPAQRHDERDHRGGPDGRGVHRASAPRASRSSRSWSRSTRRRRSRRSPAWPPTTSARPPAPSPTADSAAIVYAMGITQHTTGTDNVMTLANLAMLTGNLGKPGTGVNPLRGQNNVQGACDVGALPNVFTGYQSVTDAEVTGEVRGGLGRQAARRNPGLTADRDDGRGHRGRDQGHVHHRREPDALRSQPRPRRGGPGERSTSWWCRTSSSPRPRELADVVLPAASFAEKEGTFTNTDRRVQRVRKAVEPPGEARPDDEIVAELSQSAWATRWPTSSPPRSWTR